MVEPKIQRLKHDLGRGISGSQKHKLLRDHILCDQLGWVATVRLGQLRFGVLGLQKFRYFWFLNMLIFMVQNFQSRALLLLLREVFQFLLKFKVETLSQFWGNPLWRHYYFCLTRCSAAFLAFQYPLPNFALLALVLHVGILHRHNFVLTRFVLGHARQNSIHCEV